MVRLKLVHYRRGEKYITIDIDSELTFFIELQVRLRVFDCFIVIRPGTKKKYFR